MKSVTTKVTSIIALNFFVWLRITDESSVPEMSFWSIFLIKSDLKWCIHLRRRLFLNLQRKLKQQVTPSVGQF